MSDGAWVLSMSAIVTVFIVGWWELLRALRKPLVTKRPPVIDSQE